MTSLSVTIVYTCHLQEPVTLVTENWHYTENWHIAENSVAKFPAMLYLEFIVIPPPPNRAKNIKIQLVAGFEITSVCAYIEGVWLLQDFR